MKKLATLFSLTTLLILPTIALAGLTQPPQPGQGVAIDPCAIFNLTLNFIWPIFIGIAVLIFIYAGFLFLTAAGEPGKVSTARHALIWAIVGLAVALLAYSMVVIITNFINPPPAVVAPGSVPPGGACTINADCQFDNCLSGVCGSS